jgi:8-oxo-dGTP pyrophosphatase MutT (NUDIX family)
MGGVDDDSLPIAAQREVTEELGYTDLIYDRILSGEIHAEYYAAHK